MRRENRWGLAVAAAIFIVLLPVLGHEFVSWDDDGFLTRNPDFRGLGPAQLGWMFTTFLKGPYQPLVWLSYAADFLLWGMDPAGFHLTGLLWHCANAALLFLCARELLRAAMPGVPEKHVLWAAAFAALSFALHPLRVEPAAWASARRDLMSGFFCLAALLCHLKGRGGWTFACYCLSLLCKPMGIGLPVVFLVMDKVILKREIRWQKLLPYALPAAIAAALAWHGQAVTGATRSAAVFGPAQRLAQAFYAHAFYIAKTFWPAGLSPCASTRWRRASCSAPSSAWPPPGRPSPCAGACPPSGPPGSAPSSCSPRCWARSSSAPSSWPTATPTCPG